MTYKYIFIRRAVYEKVSDKKLKRTRTLKEIKRLFKLPYIILLILLAIAIISTIIMLIMQIPIIYTFIPMGFLIVSSIVFEISPERRIYNMEEREKEVDEKIENYKEYLESVNEIFIENGIDTPEKLSLLKAECISSIETSKSQFSSINAKLFDMMIGVPLGALLAIVIENKDESQINSIIALMIIGALILLTIKALNFIMSISDAVFKDRYLLDAINELEYDMKDNT